MLWIAVLLMLSFFWNPYSTRYNDWWYSQTSVCVYAYCWEKVLVDQYCSSLLNQSWYGEVISLKLDWLKQDFSTKTSFVTKLGFTYGKCLIWLSMFMHLLKQNKRIFVTQEYTESKKMSSALHLTSNEALF